MRRLGPGLVGADPPQQIRSGRDRLAPQGVGEEPSVGGEQHPGLQPVQQSLGQGGLGFASRCRSAAAKIAWVPHSANATTRACGNAACSPLFTPGRPKCSALASVSATSRHIPSTATSRRPANHTPGVASTPIGRATRSNNAASGSAPSRARAWKIADLLGSGSTSRSSPRPTTAHRSTARARPHTTPRSTTPSRSRSRPSPAPATTGAAARSGRPQRSPHRPAPAGTPASAPPPTPDPTDGDPSPASSTQHAAYHQTTPM